ncbi:MAG: hypothetical protein RR202_12300 [Bacteroidales bacterium]
MKRNSILGVALFAASVVSAQEMTDAYRYTKKEIVGTARYMGMAGAFGALGGDISTLSQNPAGIGVYRSSEVVATMALGGVETNTSMPTNSLDVTGEKWKQGKFNINFNNLGYVGTFKTGKREGLVNFNVGFAFNRQGGEKRKYTVTQNYMASSLTDYIAVGATNWGGDPGKLLDTSNPKYDPYYDSGAPWLTVLAYNTGLLRAQNNGNSYTYSSPSELAGLAVGGDLLVEEKSRIDEYTFNVGGNFSNIVYWGLGLGVSDLNFEQRISYDEFYWDPNNANSNPLDNTNYRLSNYLKTTGTGINVKAGLIIRPTNMLRLGVAVHTPTWYHMTDNFIGKINVYEKLPGTPWEIMDTPEDYIDYRMDTPWKYQFSTALILGKNGILSFEYDLEDYSQIRLANDNGEEYAFADQNADMKAQLKMMNTFKVGAEWRLTPLVSVRLGYANQSTAYDKRILNNQAQVFVAGTIPNYVIDRGTQYYTAGLGYRMGSFFTDMAFVWKSNQQDAYLFPEVSNANILSEKSKLTTDSFKFLLTLGYKF